MDAERRNRRRSSARRKSRASFAQSTRRGGSGGGSGGPRSAVTYNNAGGAFGGDLPGETYTPSSPFWDSDDTFTSDDSYSGGDDAAEGGAGAGEASGARSGGEAGAGAGGGDVSERGDVPLSPRMRTGHATNHELVRAYASGTVLQPRSRAALKIQRAAEMDPDETRQEGAVAVEGSAGGSGEHAGPDGTAAIDTAARPSNQKTTKPIRVREAISYVQLRQDRRKGWMSLWGFMCFAALFIVMLNMWYDIATLARTQRSFARYFDEVEYEIGRGPHDVKTGGDVWKYLRAVVSQIYNNTEYGYTPLPTNRGHVMRYTKVLNVFSITKVAVAEETCEPPAWASGRHHIFQTTDCYRLPDSWFGTKLIAESPLELDLSQGQDAVIAAITRGETVDNFLDDATTEVKIQFWFHNPQTHYTIRVRAYFAFNVFGLVRYDGLRVFPIRLFPYEKSKDYFVAACQILYALALVRFVLIEFKEMFVAVRDAGGLALGMLAYWSSLWNVVDWITAALGMTGMMFHIFYIVGHGRETLLDNRGSDFGLEWIPDLSRYTLGLAAMFYSWKTLHYFDFEPRVAMLIKTLELAWPTLTFYAASLIVIMLGYAIGGYMIVGGTGLDEFATFAAAFQSCLRMTTGEISLETIWPNEAAHPATKFAVSIFYWTFVLLVFFILLNMFIAIILDSYTMQTQQQAIGGGGGGASSASAHHKNLLLFFLDGVRVIKEYTLTKLFRRPNGSIPKVCEDHAYVFLAGLHNSGQVLVLPDDVRREFRDTPGGENMVNWLFHLQHPNDEFSFDPLVELGVKKGGLKDSRAKGKGGAGAYNSGDDGSSETSDGGSIDVKIQEGGTIAVRI